MNLMKTGDNVHALAPLKKYIAVDAKAGAAGAYCYWALSFCECKKDDESARNCRPGEMRK